MDKQSLIDLSWDEFDEHRDPRPEKNGFDQVVARAVSRRGCFGRRDGFRIWCGCFW